MNGKNDPTSRAADIKDTELIKRFQGLLPWNLARVKCFVLMVLAVLEEKTVSLQWLSKAGNPGVKSDSVRRRFERFLAGFCFKQRFVGKLVLSMLPKPRSGWVLAMDRTNWKFGRTHINILMVRVVLEGVGFPLAWLVLPKATKRGNSAKRHRIKVMEQVLGIIDPSEIKALTMDREFVGRGWLGWLDLMEIAYVARIKRNTMIGGNPASHLFLYKRWDKFERIRQTVFGQPVLFAAKRIPNGRDPYLGVVSNRFAGRDLKNEPIDHVRKLFSDMVSRGDLNN